MPSKPLARLVPSAGDPHTDGDPHPRDAASAVPSSRRGCPLEPGKDLLVGQSAPIRQLRTYLMRVAQSSANVFVVGETGTGKECVARFIHENSQRQSRALVSINCAAIPDGLLESELFGYERGAFTGASTAYAGQFRRAQGGTLFLDELGDMSTTAQAKLLRVLENREVMPLGGRREVPLDVRVIVATSTPPEQMLDARRLRPDLYYRLDVARVSVPPLRERREDAAELFEFFLRRFLPPGQRVPRLSPEAVACLQEHDWPGNVRELRNLVERILVETVGEEIDADCVRRALMRRGAAAADADAGERQRILDVLRETRWNKRRAAEKLHWSRMTLYRKMAKHGISGVDR
jgi:two-component system response regulator HydG